MTEAKKSLATQRFAAKLQEVITHYEPIIRSRAVNKLNTSLFPILREFAQDVATLSAEQLVQAAKEHQVVLKEGSNGDSPRKRK